MPEAGFTFYFETVGLKNFIARLGGFQAATMFVADPILSNDVLPAMFNLTQSQVHLGTTGKLKRSGRKAAIHGKNLWQGSITYGNAGGPPLLERHLGGDHDFFRNMHLFSSDIIFVMADSMKEAFSD